MPETKPTIPTDAVLDFRVRPASEGQAMNASWLIDAPWAHPLWSQYLVMLFDLTTPMPAQGSPSIRREGMTHEVWCFALDPSYKLEKLPEEGDEPLHHLTPANFAYQFRASDDDAAIARIAMLVRRIARGLLSPDTDYRSVWDRLFEDGVSMQKQAGE